MDTSKGERLCPNMSKGNVNPFTRMYVKMQFLYNDADRIKCTSDSTGWLTNQILLVS